MPQSWLVGKKRRSQQSFPPITRSEFAKYLERARATQYVRQPELAMRDASLLAFEFLYKTRVSEGVGRIYPESNRKDLMLETVDFKDVYEGVKISDFQIAKVKDTDVLRLRFRVLKRGRRKRICLQCQKRNAQDSSFCRFCGATLDRSKFDCKLREVWAFDSVRLDDPFVTYVLEWIEYLAQPYFRCSKCNEKVRITPSESQVFTCEKCGTQTTLSKKEVRRRLNVARPDSKVWNIGRQRAWQIMNALGIMNHTQRHWRATQLRDTHDPFELKEALHRATIPFEYVHHTESRALEKTEEADKMWQG